MCGRTESKLIESRKTSKADFFSISDVLMLSNRLPNGVLEAVIHSEPGLEGCRSEAHRYKVTYLDDLWHCIQLWGSWLFSSVYFISVAQLCLTLWPHGLQHARLPCPSPTPGPCSYSCPSSQWHLQSSHPLLSPSPPAFNLSQRQGLFQRVSYLHQMAKVLEFQLQHQSFQWNIQDWFPLGLTGLISLHSKGLSRVFSRGSPKMTDE